MIYKLYSLTGKKALYTTESLSDARKMQEALRVTTTIESFEEHEVPEDTKLQCRSMQSAPMGQLVMLWAAGEWHLAKLLPDGQWVEFAGRYGIPNPEGWCTVNSVTEILPAPILSD